MTEYYIFLFLSNAAFPFLAPLYLSECNIRNNVS